MTELPPDVEARLREKAARHGQAAGDYLLGWCMRSIECHPAFC